MKKIEYLNKEEVTISLKKALKVTILIGLLSCLIVILNTFMPAIEVANAKTSQTGNWIKRMSAPLGSEQRLSMISDNDGWFVQFSYTNNTNTAYLGRYDGFNWSADSSVTHSQQIVRSDIDMVSANDGWLVLGGWLGATPAQSSIYHWDGNNWNFFTTITDLNAISLSALDVISANDVWALGGGNFWANLYHWDGNSWQFAGKTAGGTWPDSDLDMLSANDGWAVGMNGAIAHWNGNSWAEVASPVTTQLNALAMVDSNTGWAVGDGGIILQWNGTAWISVSSPTTNDLTGIDMVSATEGWITGAGIVLYWDGTNWTNFSLSNPDSFHDIEMVSAKDGWMIGNNSLLQYVVPEPKLTMNFTSGAPGSYFNVLGQYFPPNGTATITINGHALGTVPVDSTGSFAFTFTTASADEGVYFLTVSVNPSVTKQFVLDTTEPVRPPDSPADTFDVPAGIAFTEFVYLPTIVR